MGCDQVFRLSIRGVNYLVDAEVMGGPNQWVAVLFVSQCAQTIVLRNIDTAILGQRTLISVF